MRKGKKTSVQLSEKSIKELTEINKEPSKSLPLVLRHDHYAGDIVLLLAKLFLREGETDQVCQSSAEAGNLLHLPLSLSIDVHMHKHTQGDEHSLRTIMLLQFTHTLCVYINKGFFVIVWTIN